MYVYTYYINSLVSDIDECSDGISGCNQTCTNTIGSYTCSCQSRFYTLNADGHTCDGTTYMIILK